MKEQDVLVLKEIPKNLYIVKRDFVKDYHHFSPGQLYRVENKPGRYQQKFTVEAPIIDFDLENNDYDIAYVLDISMLGEDFIKRFNPLDESLSTVNFFKWKQVTDERGNRIVQKWGCTRSVEVVDSLAVGGEGRAGVDASFFKWFTAKFEGYLKKERTEIVKITKEDTSIRHQIFFWSLLNDKDEVVFRLVIDKQQKCLGGSGIEYFFEFPNSEIDEFPITQEWASGEEVGGTGTNVPISIATLNDLRRIQHALDPFLRFPEGSVSYAAHLRDQVVRISGAVVPPVTDQ